LRGFDDWPLDEPAQTGQFALSILRSHFFLRRSSEARVTFAIGLLSFRRQLYNDCQCGDRAGDRFLGGGSDHVKLARLFKAGTMSVSALSRGSDG
jgi:hypothetical protein